MSYNPSNQNYGVEKSSVGEAWRGNVNSPTPYGIFLARINVLSEDDKKLVNKFQDSIQVSVSAREAGALAPPFDRNIFLKVAQSATGSVSEPDQVLRLTAALAHINPPLVVKDRSWIASTLEKAGIKDGLFTQPPDTSLADAVTAANSAVLATRLSAGLVKHLGNDWSMGSSLISGNFGSFYAARQLVASRGYLQPTADQSIYPSWYPGRSIPSVGATECKLGPKQAILLSFSAKPKTKHSGFWSLTVYNGEQLLVANQLDRYSLGDRSNLLYPDGTPLKDVDDGKFEILVQPDDVPPPDRYMNNWLPAPAGGGPVSFTLRVFAPAEAMLDGTYLYPEVSVVDAITG